MKPCLCVCSIRRFMTMITTCAGKLFRLDVSHEALCSDENALLEIYVTVNFRIVALRRSLRSRTYRPTEKKGIGCRMFRSATLDSRMFIYAKGSYSIGYLRCPSNNKNKTNREKKKNIITAQICYPGMHPFCQVTLCLKVILLFIRFKLS